MPMTEMLSMALNIHSSTQIAALSLIIILIFGLSIVAYLIIGRLCETITSFKRVNISGKRKQTKFKARFRR